jgi:antitoxin HicB
MRQFTFPVTLTPDGQDGGFVVTSRDVPELVTEGNTIADALEAAEGALEAAIEARIEDGLDIPLPTRHKEDEHRVGLPIGTAMKAALYQAMREQGVSKVELARRMALDEKEARRMLTPRHATKVPTLERALHVLGKRVELVVS